MARTIASRKYQLTLNNPKTHDWSHEFIRNALGTFSGLLYWCMCDEVGEEGTPHIHVYVVFKNAVQFSTIHKTFYGAHIEPAMGSNQENRDYVRKEGKWEDDKKKETNLADTFEEYGELPTDRAAGNKETEAIYEMVKNGASDYEILEKYPAAMNRLEKIERARQIVRAEKYKKEFRQLEIAYIWGQTRVGKTRYVMEKYGYENVYRVTDYSHPFDGYSGQDVILFDEFRSQLKLSEMLAYLDGYPIDLPCRYANKQACYTKVYLISNIPLEQQYREVQNTSPATWAAFKARIKDIWEMLTAGGDDWRKINGKEKNVQ